MRLAVWPRRHASSGPEDAGITTDRQRIDLIATYGDTEIEELLAYNRTAFDRQGAGTPPVLPLLAESHVAVWERYALEAAAFAVLQRRLVQLRFPIWEGISQT